MPISLTLHPKVVLLVQPIGGVLPTPLSIELAKMRRQMTKIVIDNL